MLLATGKNELVEAAQNDSIWGEGISVEDACNGKRGQGLNLLGKVLERVRKLIRKNIAVDPWDSDELLRLLDRMHAMNRTIADLMPIEDLDPPSQLGVSNIRDERDSIRRDIIAICNITTLQVLPSFVDALE